MTKALFKGLCASFLALGTLLSCNVSWGSVETTASVREQKGAKVFTSERFIEAGDKLSISTELDAKIILSSEAKIVVMSSSEERLIDLAIERKGDVIALHDELIKTLREKSAKTLKQIERLAIDIYIPSLSQIKISGASSVQMPERMDCETLSISSSGASVVKGLSGSVKTLELSLSGASDILGSNLQAESLKLSCSGASDAKLQGVFMRATVELSGASESELSGTCEQIGLKLSGSSELECQDLRCQTADILLSGSSDVKITVLERLSYSLSGSSDLYVWGKPQIESAKSTGSSSFYAKGDREQKGSK